MTEINFTGGFQLPKDTIAKKFIAELNDFLSRKKVKLFGRLQVVEFEDAEIIEECTNVEQTEAINQKQDVEGTQQ